MAPAADAAAGAPYPAAACNRQVYDSLEDAAKVVFATSADATSSYINYK